MARYLFWPRVDDWMELVVPTTEVLRVHRIPTTLARDRRIERTLKALDWLEQAPLRRQATAELNKGESRNALARAVCFHRLGRLRDRTAELQQHRARLAA